MSHEEESQYLSIVGNNMITVISLTLLVAEYFHTLELEVSVIWTAPWNLVKYLYFANKILPFLVLPFGIVYNLMPDPTPRECTLVFSVPWMVLQCASCYQKASIPLEYHSPGYLTMLESSHPLYTFVKNTTATSE
ncbi:hypothetical protein BKA70DRAFT_1567260 [Coprinopsis sp. MPI-PUGE-AT-0042]|nr:hypothetical protein BKA70DRAFT_1567260 [Coprinopsis sp. MPI-PUGE-AT-0042]